MMIKIAVLCVLLALTSVTLHMRGAKETIPAATPLANLPLEIADFHGTEQVLTPDVLQVLGDGRFLSRSYQAQNAPAQPPVDLLIAYYPTQRNGQSIHSPQNCLPGSGWTFLQSGTLAFRDVRSMPHTVAEYRVSNGPTHMEVLYWYRSRGTDIASDYRAKATLVLQAVRDGRTDGGLVRIMTQIQPGEAQAAARGRALSLAASLDPMLEQYLPN